MEIPAVLQNIVFKNVIQAFGNLNDLIELKSQLGECLQNENENALPHVYKLYYLIDQIIMIDAINHQYS